MFKPEQKDLISIFKSDTRYVIPDYQRPYSWDCIGKSNKNNQVNLMWDDLMDYFEKKDDNPYFLGSMVLIGKEQERTFTVVDGQQRLTTLILLFSAIKCFLNSVKTEEEEVKSFIKEADAIIENLIFNKKIFGARSIDKKLKIERNLGFDYDAILEKAVNCGDKIDGSNLTTEQAQIANRFFNNRKFFEEKLIENFTNKNILNSEKADKLNRFIATLQYNVTIVRILTETQDIAFKIFEILNNRGLPLSNKDLFRNFVINEFAKLKDENSQKYSLLEPNQQWHNLEENNQLTDDFLSRFVEAKKGSQQRYSSFNDIQELFKQYKESPIGKSKIELLHEDIQLYLESYTLINNSHLIENKVIANKIKFLLFADNEKYSINILLSLFRALNYKGDNNETLKKFLVTYEQFVVYLKLKTAKRFSSSPIYQAIKLINNQKFDEAIKIFELEESKLNELKELINGNIKENDIAKLLLAKYIWWQDSLEQEDVISYNFHFDKATLEHILPQKPDNDTNWVSDFSEDFRNNYTYKLGNMTLLTQSMSSAAKNRDYNYKKTIYDKTKLKITITLPSNINSKFIQNRHDSIVKGIFDDLELTNDTFLDKIVKSWLVKNPGKTITTRFPPEPNGYLHIGHAKSICLNFGLAKKYGGATNLRFDDTNPVKEDVEYVDSIREDVKWLGFDWKEELYASDYFEQLYGFAVQLIQKGLAYVDFLPSDEIAKQKGTPTEAGVNSPYRDTSIEENLLEFEKMKNGEYPDGRCTLRAKIDMTHTNMHMRDPYMYRIKHAHHHRTGDAWCIYPMYDFAHGQSDSIENITHSVCTLEFIPHREVYDWYIAELGIFPSKQYEFARLNLTNTVMSKRYLLKLVTEGVVSGWDDPRMPTISALRRRGYTPASLREFCDRIGIAKRENTIDVSLLEFCVRQDLENTAHRVMAVMDPIKLVITNYEGDGEALQVENIPGNEAEGKHEIPFGREVWIEREDFSLNPPKGYFRLMPNKDHVVRLKYAYIIKYVNHVTDENGNVTEVHVEYIKNSKSGEDQSGIKVKTALHWVSANAFNAEVRLYDRLFLEESPTTESEINANSLIINSKALLEPYCAGAEMGKSYQFFRLGYFCLDKDSSDEKMVFNKTVGLKDSFTKK